METEPQKERGMVSVEGQTNSSGSGNNAFSKVAAEAPTRFITVDKSPAAVKIVWKNNRVNSVEEFYEKIIKFYVSSGLSLIFDFREAKVDLYLFYKNVIERGGYFQVTKDGKWSEVASTLSAQNGLSIAPDKIQTIYANLFYQFEQTYHYRSNSNVRESQKFEVAPTDIIAGQSSGSGNSSGISTRKRKHTGYNDDAVKTLEKNPPLRVAKEERKRGDRMPAITMQSYKRPKNKEIKKYINPPTGFRTGYMIFLRMECERLRKMHGEDSAGQYREMANDAWRCLSETDRQPYMEAANQDKERYFREMAEYKKMFKQNTEAENVSSSTKSNTVVKFAQPSLQLGSDYHVTLSPDDADDDSTDDELGDDIVQKDELNDPTFQLN